MTLFEVPEPEPGRGSGFTPGPPAPCPGRGAYPVRLADDARHLVCPVCDGLAADLLGRVGPHLPGGLDPENPPCSARGPRVANVGSPFCRKPAGHHEADPSDCHQAHDSWGHVTW